MGRIADIINLRNPLNISNPFQQNGTSAGLIPGTVQYQQENPQKTTLQQAYEEAMSKTTPSWVTALSNAIPSIAQIGALGATKGAFNQGYVADSLERQKQRQMAYNQAKQQQEQQQVKDFVAMAEKQMGIDRADEDRDYTREQARIKSAYDKMITDRDWQNKQDLQEQAKAQQTIDNENKKQALELQRQKIKAELQVMADQNSPEAKELKRRLQEVEVGLKETESALKQAQTDKTNYENSEEYRNYVKQQEEAKAKAEEAKAIKQEIKSLNDKGAIDSETYIAINNDTDLRKYLKPKGNASQSWSLFGLPITKAEPNTYELDYGSILRDMGIPINNKNIKELKKQLGVK